MKFKNTFGLLLIVLLSMAGCEGFFGKKTETEFLDVPIYTNREVAYVPIQPVWDFFVDPVDIVPGFDEMLYVADAGTEEVIALDQAGNEQGRFPIPGITAIVQDRTLDILALGITDTTIGGTDYELSTLYRLELKNTLYGLNTAVIEHKVVHPFYFKVGFEPAYDGIVRLNGIGMLADNSYYLTRSGPTTGTTPFGGPHDAVLLFDEEDNFVSPLQITTNLGVFGDYFNEPFAISTLAQPPQSPFVDAAGDFVFTSLSSDNALQVQYIEKVESEGGNSYVPKELTTGDTTKADGFLYTPFRFANPTDVTFSGDGTNYIFVVDGEKDSLYQFTSTGLEGVKPPAGAESTKNIKASFGGTGSGIGNFSNPQGVAYLDQIVYVADAGNGRVLRFKLTTDFD